MPMEEVSSFYGFGPGREVVYHAFPSFAESVSREEVEVSKFSQPH